MGLIGKNNINSVEIEQYFMFMPYNDRGCSIKSICKPQYRIPMEKWFGGSNNKWTWYIVPKSKLKNIIYSLESNSTFRLILNAKSIQDAMYFGRQYANAWYNDNVKMLSNMYKDIPYNTLLEDFGYKTVENIK